MNRPASGWQVVELREIVPSIRNGIFARRPNDDGRGERILRISAVRHGRVDLRDIRTVEGLTRDQVTKFSVNPGDILVTRYNGSRQFVGIPGLVTPHVGRTLHPDKLIRLVPDRRRVDPRFLTYQLQSASVRAFLEPRIRTTAGQSGISGDDIRGIPVALPDMNEQRRIVDILEDHLSQLEAGDGGLATVQRRLAAMWQSALHVVVAGPFATLGELAVESSYGTSTKCDPDGLGVAVARIPNIRGGHIDMTDVKHAVDVSLDLTSLLLRRGDVLIVRTNGSINLIGRSAVATGDIEAAFASYLIRYRVDEAKILPRWVHLALESPLVRREIEAMAASSAGQHNLGLAKLNRLRIPCPPLSEQVRVMEELRSLEDSRGRLSSAVEATQQRSGNLRQALLTAAFSGKLTGRRTDYEVIGELAHV